MVCIRCGKCCTLLSESTSVPNLERGVRWLEMHGLDIVHADGVSRQIIYVMNVRCRHLVDVSFDEDSGEMVRECGIYDERPEICRKYVCKRARGDENDELAREFSEERA